MSSLPLIVTLAPKLPSHLKIKITSLTLGREKDLTSLSISGPGLVYSGAC